MIFLFNYYMCYSSSPLLFVEVFLLIGKHLQGIIINVLHVHKALAKEKKLKKTLNYSGVHLSIINYLNILRFLSVHFFWSLFLNFLM